MVNQRPKADIESMYYLSPLQEGLLFHHVAEGREDPYVDQTVYYLDGALDRQAFERAWQLVSQRHAVLRTAFIWTKVPRPIQVVQADGQLSIDYEDWRSRDDTERSMALQELLEADRQRGFEFRHAPLMRLRLLQLSDHTFYLLFMHHHILLDGWSFQLLVQEALTFYAGLVKGQVLQMDSVRPYQDYIVWLQRQDIAAAEQFWRQYLLGLSGPTILPLQKPGDHSERRPELRYAEQEWLLTAAESERVRAFVRQHHLTVNTLVQGAWALLLQRYGNATEVVFGSTVSGRPPDLEGADTMVGLFLNTLPVRVRMDQRTKVVSWLQALQEQNSALRRYEYTPLTKIQAWSELPSGQPLFETIVVFENFPTHEQETSPTHGVRIRSLPKGEWIKGFMLTKGRNNYPLSLIAEPGKTFRLTLCYARARGSHGAITRLLMRYQRVVEWLLTHPQAQMAEVTVLTPEERRQVLVEWNPTAQEPLAMGCIQELIEMQVRIQPERVAVVSENDRLTYAELNARANRLAHALRARGVSPGIRVGLCFERSLELLIGLIGILKAGGAYVPVEPTLPPERLIWVLQDAQVAGLLTHAAVRTRFAAETLDALQSVRLWDLNALLDEAIESTCEENLPAPDSQNLAYLIYTSGSTGQPKGVAVSHHALVGYVSSVLARIPVSESATQWALLSTVAADLGHTMLFGALCSGRTLHLLSTDRGFHPEQMADYMRREQIDVLKLTPSHLAGLLDATQPEQVLPKHCLILGGEALQWSLVERIQALAPHCAIINHYGPTEATVGALTHSLPFLARSQGATVPIGRPLAHSRAYILDRDLEPVPVGVPGELYLGGTGLAQGYHAQPGLTAERFVPDPFATQASSRLYRTGDQARYREDGTIESLGRQDQQVKLRGYRIELGEIEAQLRQHPDIHEAVVVMRENRAEVKQLVAYVVTQPGHVVQPSALRASLARHLPDYMIPQAFVSLEALPLTRNGKLDRAALPDPETERDGEGARDAVPQTETEQILAAIWAEVLRCESVGRHDNFFELGGDSILSLQIIARAHRRGLHLTPKQLFEHPTVAELAKFSELDRSISHADEQTVQYKPFSLLTKEMAEFAQLLQEQNQEIEDAYPMAPVQEGMLFHSLYDQKSHPYMNQMVGVFTLALDRTAFETAWEYAIHKHAILRTGFLWKEHSIPIQIVSNTATIAIEEFDWRNLHDSEQKKALDKYLTSDRERGFDFDRPPLMRIALFYLSDERCMMVWTFHHLILDGWCQSFIAREVFTIYQAARRGESISYDPAPPYRNFIAWLQRQDLQCAEMFWREYLKGFTAPTTLFRQVHHSQPVHSHFAERHLKLTTQATTTLQKFAKSQRVTLNTLMQAAWAMLLSSYSGETDVLFGITVSGRPVTLPHAESMVGVFINTLPLRLKVDPSEKVTDWVKKIQSTNLELNQFEHTPLVRIHRVSDVKQGVSLFDSILVFQNYPIDHAIEGYQQAVGIEISDTVGWTNYPLTIGIEPREELHISFSYDHQRFGHDSIQRIMMEFENLLKTFTKFPQSLLSEIPLLREEDRNEMTVTWNRTMLPFEKALCVHQLFEKQVEVAPLNTAVICGEHSLTYWELNAKANQVANYLREHGVGPEVRVGLCLERSMEMVVSLLAILKAGGSYVPIDPTYPKERRAYMLKDSRVDLLLSQEHLVMDMLPISARLVCLDRDWIDISNRSEQNLPNVTHPLNVAYIIYTSGSTGRPKGVMISHRALANQSLAAIHQYGLTHLDRVLQFAALSFDVAAEEMFPTWLCGASVIFSVDRIPQSFGAFLQFLEDEELSVVGLPAPYWHQWVTDLAETNATLPARLRLVIVGNDSVSAERLTIWQRLIGNRVRWINAYGPTESTITATVYEPEEHWKRYQVSTVPIGKPMANKQVYILDSFLRLVPPGVPGEIHIGGLGTARGYFERPDLTAERFIPNPFGSDLGTRLYRTGDRAHYCSDGTIVFGGRFDRQVKIRGFRVELGEIETLLMSYPGIQEAAVVMKVDEENHDSKELIAFVGSNRMSRMMNQSKPHFWPSLGEYPVYDELMYTAMTYDEPRVEVYRRAVERSVKDKLVVDIGTGKDVVLARMCIEAGARKVYAIELIEEAYIHAKRLVKHLGLQDRITVIHGNSTEIELPENVDVCVSEIFGTIGGSEGAAVTLTDARRFLKSDGIFIPIKSVTKVAAIQLPNELVDEPTFSEVTDHYVKKIFEHIGYPFDLRICIKNFPHASLISDSEEFEVLNFEREGTLNYEQELALTIVKKARLDGLLLWLNLQTSDEDTLNILDQETNWLPLYFPLFNPGINVCEGDVIRLVCSGMVSDNGINPDYKVSGTLIRQNGEKIEFAHESSHHARVYKQTNFYANLFQHDQSSVKTPAQNLRAYLQERCPEHMIPTNFVILDVLPLTSNGKVDRQKLSLPQNLKTQGEYAAPRTDIEEKLVKIWEEVLRVDLVGVHDNFFELGGHSLLATQLMARLRRVFQIELPLHYVFENPTVATLANCLDLTSWGRGEKSQSIQKSEANYEEIEI